MKEQGIHAFIFPSSDPHNSEYVAEHWKGREWVSGFNGSAGTAVVTLKHAALWTDSRYFIAAAEQLAGTEYLLMKDCLPDTPSISEWIAQELSDYENPVVGVDGTVNTYASLCELMNELNIATFVTNLHHADGLLVTALDEIAWTLNLRGKDVHCNPVFVSYLLISQDSVMFFVNEEKLPDDVRNYLLDEAVSVEPYEAVLDKVKGYKGRRLLMDPTSVNYNLVTAVDKTKRILGISPIPMMKAVKNKTEQGGFRAAMLRDGIAMVKFLAWLKPAVEAGGQTEITLDEHLTALRAEQPLFKGISFDTIVGYEAHGAIVHYEATPETDIPVKPYGLVLIDSGAQYQDGTTDITRTIALGSLTEEQRRVYTLVLKGHIQLDMCRFPDGACGSQIDAIARESMWREGYNYMHGTGHGVGSYLNVHEGPHQIRMEWRPAPLHAGMTVTDEPGLYLEGKFGVRIENTLLIVPAETTPFGKFLKFETLTLAPIDTTPIIQDMLTPEELTWLNNYHHRVYETLSPYLEKNEKKWLEEATRPL